MQRRGAGDYLVCAPTYKLLDKAAVPYIADALGTKLQLGKLIGGSQGRFEVSPRGELALWGARQDKPTRIVFGHADEPESLEAAQYKGAVCDEAGQKRFKPESWEAIQRRLAIDKGRCLFPTTPYSIGWLYEQVYERAKRREAAIVAGQTPDLADADYDVVNFVSIDNPAFPIEEWERAKATLPPWRFDLFFRGIFSRPAGAVYDCFEPSYHVLPSQGEPPQHWPRYCGIDFGAPNFAAVFIAEEMVEDGATVFGQSARYRPTGRLIAYREYRPDAGKTARQHVEAMWAAEPRLPDDCVGGAHSEGQWRAEFAAAGWPIREPDQRDVEVGIQRVYSAFRDGHLFITRDCPRLIKDVQQYSRELDDVGNTTNDLEDKEQYHGADSLRYIVAWLRRIGSGLDLLG